jgi:hypothetical protein
MVKDDGCMCWSPEYDRWRGESRHKLTTGVYDGQYDFDF